MFILHAPRRRRKRNSRLAPLALLAIITGVIIVLNKDSANISSDKADDVISVTEPSKVVEEAITPKTVEAETVLPITPTTIEEKKTEPVKIEGNEVVSNNGFKITVPKEWYYYFTQENGQQIINLGTKNFGPENPYNPSIKEDVYGYITTVNEIPSEAIGALVEMKEITGDNGQAINKKIYETDIPDGGRLSQFVYTFSLNENQYGFVFFSAATNTSSQEKADLTVKTVTSL